MVPFSLFVALRLFVAVLGGAFSLGEAGATPNWSQEFKAAPESGLDMRDWSCGDARFDEAKPVEGEWTQDSGGVVTSDRATVERVCIRVPGFARAGAQVAYLREATHWPLWRLGSPIRGPPNRS
jgi:hypothetical protein